MTPVSPLGRYSAIAALVVSLGVILAAVLYRVLYREGDPFLDQAAMVAVGVVLGSAGGVAVGTQAGQSAAAARINGLASQVQAANLRLDATPGAPSAPVAAAQLGVPVPGPDHG